MLKHEENSYNCYLQRAVSISIQLVGLLCCMIYSNAQFERMNVGSDFRLIQQK